MTGLSRAPLVMPFHDPFLILASASPRRAELLTAAGFQFNVSPVQVDESRLPNEPPAAYVQRLAIAKASAIPQDGAGGVTLGADTVVVVGDDVLGKPSSDDDAAAMLRQLSDRTHEVLTGVAVRRGKALATETARTLVRFSRLSNEEIAWYVRSGEPWGKAGAYAIQGVASRFVEGIEGSYSNVVGLPVSVVYRLVRAVSGSANAATSPPRD